MFSSRFNLNLDNASKILFRHFARGAAWSFVAGLSAQFGLLFSTFLIIRLLDSEAFGQYSIALTTVNLTVALGGLCVSTATVKYTAELKNSDPDKLSLVLTGLRNIAFTASFIAIIFIALTLLILNYAFSENEFISIVLISIPASFFLIFDNYYKSLLIGLGSMRDYALSSVFCSIISIPVIFTFSSYFGLKGAVGGLILVSLIQCVVSRQRALYRLKQHTVQHLKGVIWPEKKLIFSFLVPTLIAGIGSAIAPWLVQMMLAQTKNGITQVAILSVAMQWFNMIMFIPVVSSRIVAPMLTEAVTKFDTVASVNLFKLSIVTNLFSSMVAALFIWTLAPFIGTIYGADFVDGSLTVLILTLAALLASVLMPVGNLLAAKSNMWLAARMNIAWSVLYITGSALLNAYGSIGVAVAFVMAYLAHALWGLTYSIRTLSSKRVMP